MIMLMRNGFASMEWAKSLTENETEAGSIIEKGKSKSNKVTFIDSLKILNMSVDDVAKCFNLPISKLTLDYDINRPIGHILTDEEVSYIKNDVVIMSIALDIMFKANLKKMTIGADALANYKEMNKNFNHYFPTLQYELDDKIRKSYKGGFTYLNEIYRNKQTGEGIVLDVNSLYPSVMYNEILPFGDPIYYEGKYEEVYEKYLDIHSFIDYYLVQTLTNNTEFAAKYSVYCYKKRNGKLYAGPLWDFEYTTFTKESSVSNIGALWYQYLFKDEAFKKALKQNGLI